MRGIEACAWVLAHAVDGYAVAGGEGSRRLADAVEAVARSLPRGGPERYPGDGVDAARAALGAAAAGRRVAVLASGDALAAVAPVLREMARLGVAVVVAVASHGDDGGRPLPEAGTGDLAAVLDGPAGVLLAGDPGQVADLTLVALRASSDRGAPWVVGFDLAAVGLAAAAVALPSAEAVRGWMAQSLPPSPPPADRAALALAAAPGEAHLREVERYGFAAGAALRELERSTGRRCGLYLHDGPRDAEVVLVSAGASARGARSAVEAGAPGLRLAAVQVVSLRPMPVADLVRLTWRARVVLVHEAFPEAVGTGGRLGDALKAAYTDALTWHPGHAGIGRVPPVVTVHTAGAVGAAGWLDAVQRADTQEPARWLPVSAEALAGDDV